jgi:hypothetical protein
MVTVGNYTTAAGNSVIAHLSVTNTSSASASDIEGMTFTIQIADGNGTTPKITSVDLLNNTIWSGHVTPPSIFPSAGGDQPQYQSLGLYTDIPGDYVDANGILANVTIDTTGASGGNYSIELVGTKTAGVDSTFLDFIGDTVPATFTPGSITVIVPEPSQNALPLLGIFSLFLSRKISLSSAK